MQKAHSRSVVLPGGETIEIFDTPQKSWTMHNAYCHMDPKLLAPDPDQPRKEMSKTKLEELEASIKTCGVLQPIIVTPRALAPWVQLRPEHKHLPFVIVSGHRRTRTALKGNIPAVPIVIKVFKDEIDHRTNGGVLNSCHDDLTDLEKGFEYLREKKAGKTIAQIADAHGINALTVQNKINLTRLHPDLFQFLDLDPKTGKRILPIYPASILGGIPAPSEMELESSAELFADVIDVRAATGRKSLEGLTDDERRFAMQRMLVAVIRKRSLNSTRAAEFIRDRTLIFKSNAHGPQTKTERYQPARRKEILLNLTKEVTGSAILDWSAEEFGRVFRNSSQEDDDKVLKQLKDAHDVIAEIINKLSKIRNSKRAMSPEVAEIIARAHKSANAT